MLAKIHCAAVQGIAAHAVEVEVNDGYGETLVIIVGLPDAAVRESRDRVTTALTNSGFKMPLGRITINLAPADIRKEGPSFDSGRSASACSPPASNSSPPSSSAS